jgi:primosomal protein N' (replication factor Y) (superfamily II helicase)
MLPGAHKYCDVSLPVPLDQAFTYALPETLRHRVLPGCRLIVPFGSRRLTGIVLRCHDELPPMETRSALRLVDTEPVLDQELLALGRWIAQYYCAPLGEVLRGMTPLASEIRQGKVYALTDAGRDATRQLLLGDSSEDPTVQLLHMLEARSLSAATIQRKIPLAAKTIQSLERKGLVHSEALHAEKDPLRSAAARLRVELHHRPEDLKLPKAERELLSYLELHPGSHNLKQVEQSVKNASTAARALARKGLLTLTEERPGFPVAAPAPPPHVLNPHQQKAFDAILGALRSRSYQAFLLFGVTGSGKTEVYLRSIEATLAMGRSALLLVPEIALTPAMAGQFFQRFGDRVAILHSAFSDAERAGQWRRIRSGAAPVVVGTRSGVFAPVPSLGLIVVDEEHDQSYKQDEAPRYNGRDVAIVRAQAAGACVVMGSATPSLESRHNADRGKYILLELPERIERRPLPQVELVDLRVEFLETRKQATFSRKLLDAIRARLAGGEQTMLLLNRRGFASFLMCRACGERLQCVNCSVTLTFHRRDRRMLCHYCNYATSVPHLCPKCQSEHVHFQGIGAERVEEELHREFPKARIARMDRDTVTGKRLYESILHGFREGSYDILVGTQMIAKGHDIPNVTLVGVVNADIGLALPDFRSAERTFQLLTQVAGRAGRGSVPGIVLVQTNAPDHYAVRSAAAQDYQRFYEKELQFRRAMRYPPFSVLANILVRDENQERALRMSGEIGHLLSPPPEGLRLLGPAEAPVARVQKEFRYQVLLKAVSRKTLGTTLERVRSFALESRWPPTALVIDVDPLSLM